MAWIGAGGIGRGALYAAVGLCLAGSVGACAAKPSGQEVTSASSTTVPTGTVAPATGATPTTIVPTTAPPTTAAPTTERPTLPERKEATPRPPAIYTMPSLVGRTLQEAQDVVQKAAGNPLFRSKSHDLTGEDRSQVRDSNWKVCTQNIPPGASFTDDDHIDFGVVKLDEKCP